MSASKKHSFLWECISPFTRAFFNAKRRWKALIDNSAVGRKTAIFLCAAAVAYVSFVLLASGDCVPAAMLVAAPFAVFWALSFAVHPGIKSAVACLPGGNLANTPGAYLTLLVAALAIGIVRRGWKCAVLGVPFLAYSFGTMLFLGGPEFRFFYAVVLSGAIASLPLLGVPKTLAGNRCIRCGKRLAAQGIRPAAHRCETEIAS